ncbi:MAG TPA: hypothetical protein VIN59_00740, partial [Alphaproteobacteria bacterium]
MPSYEHKQLVEQIVRLDTPPSDPVKFSKWIEAEQHLALLSTNTNVKEIIVYGAGEYSFIHSIVVPNKLLS